MKEKTTTTPETLTTEKPAALVTTKKLGLSEIADERTVQDQQSIFDILDAAEQATDQQGESLDDAAYWKPQENEVYNIMVTGIEKATIDGKETRVVAFKDKHNAKFITAAAVLLNTVERLEQLPLVLRVKVGPKQKAKAGGGSYYTFDIIKL